MVYGRPSKNGEKILGEKVAYGELWRTGANEATEVKFYNDVTIGNKKLNKGTYILYTIPGEKEWEVIFNTNLDVMGAFQYNPLFDVLRFQIPVTKAEELETFSIAFKDKNNHVEMVLGWETTRIKIPLEFKKINQFAKL